MVTNENGDRNIQISQIDIFGFDGMLKPDNGFEYIGMTMDKQISLLAEILNLERLKEKVIEPYLQETFGKYAGYFCYFNICQIEVHYDTLFESKGKAKKAMKLWCLLNHFYFNRNCKISIKASKYKFLYSYKGLQIKGYVRGCSSWKIFAIRTGTFKR